MRVSENPSFYRQSNITLGVTVGVTLDVPYSRPIRGGELLEIGDQFARKREKVLRKLNAPQGDLSTTTYE